MKLVKTYTYDPMIYTEALELLDKHQVLISSGKYGSSHLGVYDLRSQTYTPKKHFAETTFAEGATRVENTIWLLTFKEETAFKFSYPHFELEGVYPYDGDGWGLASDTERCVLWMSNGTARLQARDPDTFKLLDTIEVTDAGQPVVKINELEYANGYLYANIWQSHNIIKIDVETGEVIQTYQLTSILEEAGITEKDYPNIDVLNGIAHIRENEFLLSGKYYPYLLRVVLD